MKELEEIQQAIKNGYLMDYKDREIILECSEKMSNEIDKLLEANAIKNAYIEALQKENAELKKIAGIK